jgi:hypothetical protein
MCDGGMAMIDELVNDYCILGDDGAVIFASYDHVLEFVEKIRSDKREWVGFTDGEKKYLKALGYVGIEDIESRLKRMNT